ncbi:uncharacterized protein LOC114126471 [Aphis gossypii]|uniref:uncharacterized protein LOC114126471 n=1 Tax=Aphis gossypii TaxID=80765 RepID=UPI0021597134|nr:uncharacterized protein LOC114126471 [Aphis gossypii]XP_050063847.1 uncharacterized protein LOC114126471 [Aphis gossypii]XP_050063848.1 uncharacterized protein LOC114126471 [Aphis gossypii]XP_050063849.1 uncharacterized protein LOC114126471 [Aphis gossypii]XP_050063850.1 uncharacterized protein LOC114126471 [Aphis gossypii]XP_050063851.1 uncharacterized protein LOC114126471 [Aphis gossypii]XP_050063852.1 uncharacterized protein LOC114126471 [Aphis gossypii]XP_050063853.1 uncharacterized p
MDDSALGVNSLYNLTVQQICQSMDENTLVYVMKSFHPAISLDIVWKMLHVNDDSQNFEYKHTLPYEHKNYSQTTLSMDRGYRLATSSPDVETIPNEQLHKSLLKFAENQQTKFIDNFNFSDHFDLELLFKFMEVTISRGQLFTIFQICVQIKGLQFPKNLSQEWIQIEIDDNDQKIIFRHIEQGLKLGIFLGDAGWLNESAQVLSHTHKIMNTKWECFDQNLKLLKNIQCLTKWLFVLSKIQNFIEAKKVFKLMLFTLSVFENMKEKSLCIANSYVAVSQYFYLLMEFDEAWSWAVKATDELGDNSSTVLKMSVISHAIKISSILKKFDTAKRLKNQLDTYDKQISQLIHINMLSNEAIFLSKEKKPIESSKRSYMAIDSTRNLFGYYNLNTAIILSEFAYSRFLCFKSATYYTQSMQSLQQAIYIMEKIGLPIKNVLFLNTIRIKALIIEKTVSYMSREPFAQNNGLGPMNNGERQSDLAKWRDNILDDAEMLHKKILHYTSNVAPKFMLAAKSYTNLGSISKMQKRYKRSELMYLKAIGLKETILNEKCEELAQIYSDVYSNSSNKTKMNIEHVIKSSEIFLTFYGYHYKEVQNDLEVLKRVSKKLKKIDDFNEYNTVMDNSFASRTAGLCYMFGLIDDELVEFSLSMEAIKSILNTNYNLDL